MNLYPPPPSLGVGDTRFNGLGEEVFFPEFVVAVRPTGFSRFHEKFYMKMLESLHSVEIKYFYVVGLHKKSSNCEPFVTRVP